MSSAIGQQRLERYRRLAALYSSENMQSVQKDKRLTGQRGSAVWAAEAAKPASSSKGARKPLPRTNWVTSPGRFTCWYRFTGTSLLTLPLSAGDKMGLSRVDGHNDNRIQNDEATITSLLTCIMATSMIAKTMKTKPLMLMLIVTCYTV